MMLTFVKEPRTRLSCSILSSYQFEPHRAVARVAVQILLKALVNMPKPDFSLLKSVLPCNLVSLLLTTYLML